MLARRLAIFGITGATGRVLARVALERGWAVRGLARPQSDDVTGLERATLVRGQLTDAACVAEVVDAAEAVCCVLGPRPPYTEAFCAPATASIIGAMRQKSVRRIICQTGAMVGEANRTLFFEWMAASFARRQPAVARDRVEQERLVMQSGLAWTIVKPPRLTTASVAHPVRAAEGLRVGMLSRVGRASLADFHLQAIDREDWVGARLIVSE